MAEMRRDTRFQLLRAHGREQPHLLGAPQPPGIDRDEHVGRAVLPLGADALDERVFLPLDQIHLDAGGGGEILVEAGVGGIVARRIDVDHRFFGPQPRGEEHRRQHRHRRERFFHTSSVST